MAREVKLLLIWSSLHGDQYVQAIAESTSGKVEGPWVHMEELFFHADGGHGMLFRDKENRLLYTLHSPNTQYSENPQFYEVEDNGETLLLKGELKKTVRFYGSRNVLFYVAEACC